MIKKSIIFFVVLSGLLCLFQIQAYSQAKATVHLIGGYNYPLGDLRGDFGDSNVNWSIGKDSLTYLMKSGYSFGFIIKKAYGKNGNFRGTANVNFSLFSQSGHYEYPNVITDIELQINILSIAAGAEWAFAPKKSKVNPFVGVEFGLNFFSGSLTGTDDFQDTTDDRSSTLNMKPSIRFGVQIGGGVDYQIHQSVGFIAGVKYNWANVLGKKFTKDNSSEYGLNDEEHQSGTYTRPARNITFLQIYGGLSYYFGR